MCPGCAAGRSLVVKEIAPEARAAVEQFFREYRDVVDDVRVDLVQAIRDGDLDPSTTDGVRAYVQRVFGDYSSEFDVVFREGVERGAEAGREIAARRHQLDIAFDRVPEDMTEVLDDWALGSSETVTDRLGDDITSYVRGAHEEGLSIDDLAEQINDDLFEGRLQDWEAERIARTNTIPSSNAGTHSAMRDADSVVGEEWIAELDGRERDTHAEADGQIVAVDGTFLVGGYEAGHPGDPTLPAEEIINCRCTLVPVFRDELTDSEFSRLESGGRLNAAASAAGAPA